MSLSRPTPLIPDSGDRSGGADPELASFTISGGGPFFRFLCRLGLAGDEMEFLSRRIVAASAVAWIPLAILSIFGGRAWGNAVRVPFFSDIDLYARLLLGLPLLFVAERVVFRRTRGAMPEFLHRGIVPDAERPRFDAAVASARRWRDSSLAEGLILLVVYSFGVLYLWRHHFALPMATWYAIPSGVGHRLTAAGWWYALVTLPLVQFLLLRWYYRIGVLALLLWRISRLNLRLIPTHPDHCGGLGFLANVCRAFWHFLFVQGVFVAGAIANRIFFGGAQLAQFRVELAVFTVLSLLLVLGPSLAFFSPLGESRRAGRREYGRLAGEYALSFDRRWVSEKPDGTRELLGHSDIQSLADMANSYELIRRMQLTPFNRGIVLELAFAALAPVAPLLLTMFPVEALIERVVKMIF
ncbi:MAG TPA: hypothetical protein VFS34_13265 [Thermoanaerobaculia bacterium]|nr:hypothetical protein [Thermoanaerobaculia bacterium]